MFSWDLFKMQAHLSEQFSHMDLLAAAERVSPGSRTDSNEKTTHILTRSIKPEVASEGIIES